MKYKRVLCWIRRDLRLSDHTALAEACRHSEDVVVVFVFDRNILQKLKNPADRRLTFIYDSLAEVSNRLQELNSKLVVLRGDPVKEIPALARRLEADAVFTNEDYETYAKSRDRKVAAALSAKGQAFHSFKDQVIFSGAEVLKSDGTAYQVFTPYKNAWLKKFKAHIAVEQNVQLKKLVPAAILKNEPSLPNLTVLGFQRVSIFVGPGESGAIRCFNKFRKKLARYSEDRDYPELDGTSHLSVHLRFGTISIRSLVRECMGQKSRGAQVWLSELIWREFYFMILDQFPHVEKGAFKKQYDNIQWPGKIAHFRAWCEGRTGYPIVDAGMRQLNETGFMHNRLRMIVASFLVKDLLIDWRKGESYFAEQLLDFDLAANSGGWQWCASTGCDAQPYFRIFNPYSQLKKFDPKEDFVKKWVPEAFDVGGKYASPIVDHGEQRVKAVLLYKTLA